ncbi:hypothetical protein QFZ77_004724 [Paenibacillus sp. V4I3]|uniref:hypothetical protein n=1 Tax=Paenibacillus sp. V4I3 TaxID=3042305 RepID=UPI002788D9AE|nr:hypothetical protein [Paenibacillus sp. V4I3]MDQ0876065.1 hypothetical protein [Paenibacillus sp. V4I3]
MNVPVVLDGANVLKYAVNGSKTPLSIMIFEVEDGSQKEVAITALAIAKYETGDKYYLFMCDKNWVVLNDFDLDTVDEAMQCASTSFSI